jgi:hypothetical protein
MKTLCGLTPIRVRHRGLLWVKLRRTGTIADTTGQPLTAEVFADRPVQPFSATSRTSRRTNKQHKYLLLRELMRGRMRRFRPPLY